MMLQIGRRQIGGSNHGLAMILLFVFSLGSTCMAADSSPCERDPKQAEPNSWFATTPAAYGGVYLISRERRERIVKNYPKVGLGITKKDVEVLLGGPDFEAISKVRQKGVSKGRRELDGTCTRQWAYYFRKAGDNLADVHDVLVLVSFDSEGKLFWAMPQNIPELSQKGSPLQ